MTIIMPMGHAKDIGSSNKSLALLPIRHEFVREPVFMRSREMLAMPRTAEFDCVCLAIWYTDDGGGVSKPSLDPKSLSMSMSRLRTRRLLCIGLSGEMMLVDVNESDDTIHLTQQVQIPQVIIMENMSYAMYDKRYRLHMANTTNLSRLTLKGLPPPAPHTDTYAHTLFQRPAIAEFQAWVTQPSTQDIQELVLELAKRFMDQTNTQREIVVSTFNTAELNQVG